MGGNALKNTKTRRYEKDEYFLLEEEVINKVYQYMFDKLGIFPNVQAIKAYKEKNSFGDMDILVESIPNWDYLELIKEVFSPNEYVRNGNVISFDFKELQIDFIVTPSHQIDASAHYFSYNDLGNFLGRLAKKFGFKYGHDGLTLYFRDGDLVFKKMTVSHDMPAILHFLGLSIGKYQQGFSTMTDVYDFVVSSPFFNPDIFLLENRNHISRVRDAKRKSYHDFLEYLKTKDNLTHYPWGSLVEKGVGGIPPEQLPRIKAHFPLFETLYENTKKEYNEWKKRKNAFSGERVREWTGLNNQPLGEFMKYLNAQTFQGKTWKEYVNHVMDVTPENDLEQTLKQLVLTQYAQYQK